MTLRETFQNEIKIAMKAQDKERLEILRLLLSAVKYEEIEKKVEPLPDAQVQEIVKRELKKKHEEIEYAEKAQRPDMITKLKRDLITLEAFLPQQLSREELSAAIKAHKAQNPQANMGTVMAALKQSHAGQYDGKLASEVAKEVLAAG